MVGMKKKYTPEQHEMMDGLSAESIDVVFICAIQDEYDRFLKQLDQVNVIHAPHPRLKRLNGYTYERFLLYVESKPVQCLVALQNIDGMIECACLSSILLQYSPKLVVMSGICGGVTGNVMRGNIVVATMTFDYGAGKYYSDGRFVPKYHPTQQGDKDLLEAVKLAIDDLKEIVSDCPPEALIVKRANGEVLQVHPESIKVIQGPMGTGAAVVNNKSIIVEIQGHSRDIVAYDMEAYALARMCDTALARKVPWLVVKGVQDLYDTPDNEKNEYNKLASFVSAAFAIEVAKYYVNEIS